MSLSYTEVQELHETIGRVLMDTEGLPVPPAMVNDLERARELVAVLLSDIEKEEA